MSSSTMEVGRRLVELCREGRTMEAMDTLYAPNVVSIEAMSMGPTMPARTEGFAAVRARADAWEKSHEIHRGDAEGPWPHGDRFIVRFNYDVTAKAGPMAGKRMTIDEAGLYTVKDGKIIQAEYFYDMSGA